MMILKEPIFKDFWRISSAIGIKFGDTSVLKYNLSPSQKKKEINTLSSIKLITGLFFPFIYNNKPVILFKFI